MKNSRTIQKSNKNTLWYVVKKLSNLNISIFILLLIALVSILGTIIEQDQTISYYQLNYPVNQQWISYIINWQIITLIGLNNIYTNWYFLGLLGLFFCTLIACTFSRQLPSLRKARNWKFITNNLHNSKQTSLKLNKKYNILSNMIHRLSSKNYYVFQKKNNLYSYKGIAGKIAPIFVHISIIFTLIGSIIGLFTGFTAQQTIPNGELFHIHNVIKSGFRSSLPTNIVGKIDDFKIEYYNNGSIKQFYSKISLFNHNGDIIKQKQISVNSPLIFNGITFYQTNWIINGIRFSINNKYHIQKSVQEIKIKNIKIWIYKLPINLYSYISLVITNLSDKVLLYDGDGKFLYEAKINEKFNINNINFKIEEIMTCTGLQIKVDPGVKYVYIGFFILIISILLSYLSYSQIWIYDDKIFLYIKGTTNRSKIYFEEEIINIQHEYNAYY